MLFTPLLATELPAHHLAYSGLLTMAVAWSGPPAA